jgi:queuine/archaeosine tRNA-ribosyltransferase
LARLMDEIREAIAADRLEALANEWGFHLT